MIPWVITREADDAAPLVAKLAEWGFDATCIAAIERKPLHWPDDLDVDAADAIWFFTSPFAAKRALAHVKPGQRIAAIEPATARVVAEAGAHVDVAARGGSVGLAKAVVERGLVGLVLYPTSDAGVDAAEQSEALAILKRVGPVRREAVYTTAKASTLAAELEVMRGKPYAAVLFSPSAVEALASAVQIDEAPPPLFSICVGESTKRAHDAMHPAPSSKLVPRGVDVADFIFAFPHKPETA